MQDSIHKRIKGRKRPIIVCLVCKERVWYPVDYLLGMILKHEDETGHSEFKVTIPKNLRLKVE